jgi:hypothetical protein
VSSCGFGSTRFQYIDGMHGDRGDGFIGCDDRVLKQATVRRKKPCMLFIALRDKAMKPVTADMLRAHLMVASLTAVAADLLACVTVFVDPGAEHLFVSVAFRLSSIAVMAGGVMVARQFAQAAFRAAVADRHASVASVCSRPIDLASDCPRLWLVVLHLRLTGKPFVLSKR